MSKTKAPKYSVLVTLAALAIAAMVNGNLTVLILYVCSLLCEVSYLAETTESKYPALNGTPTARANNRWSLASSIFFVIAIFWATIV